MEIVIIYQGSVSVILVGQELFVKSRVRAENTDMSVNRNVVVRMGDYAIQSLGSAFVSPDGLVQFVPTGARLVFGGRVVIIHVIVIMGRHVIM